MTMLNSGRNSTQYPEIGETDLIMKQFAIIIEKGSTSFGAYVPDLPGCVAVATTEAEVRQLIREAIELHVRSMEADGEPVPEPTTQVEYATVPFKQC